MKTVRLLAISCLLLLVCSGSKSQTAGQGTGRAKPGAAGSAPALGSVEGKVVKAGTGEPLRKVTVTLRRAEEEQFDAETDSSGRFSFDEVPPGAYEVRAERKGFVEGYWSDPGRRVGGNYLSVEPGQRREGVNIQLLPGGVVVGRIYDSDGDPVIGASIEARLVVRSASGVEILDYEYGSTNDLGEFRIFGLRPGHYVVCARFDKPGIATARRVSRLGWETTPRMDMVPTCYPNTADVAQATPVAVRPGEELRVDLTFSSARVFVVRGRAQMPAQSSSQIQVQVALYSLASRDEEVSESSRAQSGDSAGNFEIRDGRPGRYLLYGRVIQGENEFEGMLEIQVSEDMDGIVLPLAPGAELTGIVHFPGNSRPKQAWVHLTQQGPDVLSGFSPGMIVNADGSFHVRNVMEGEYVLGFNDPSEGHYIKSAKLGGVELNPRRIRLTSGSVRSDLEIWLGKSAAVVEGKVVQDQKAVDGIAICMFSDELMRRRYPDCRQTDHIGAFRFEKVTPGEYRMLAVEDARDLRGLLNQDSQKHLEPYVKVIRVEENSKVGMELKPMPRTPPARDNP